MADKSVEKKEEKDIKNKGITEQNENTKTKITKKTTANAKNINSISKKKTTTNKKTIQNAKTKNKIEESNTEIHEKIDKKEINNIENKQEEKNDAEITRKI